MAIRNVEIHTRDEALFVPARSQKMTFHMVMDSGSLMQYAAGAAPGR